MLEPQESELTRQSHVLRALGSPFVADVLAAGARQLHHAPATAGMLADWPDDPSSAAVAMRFNAALHALARRDTPPVLGSLYRGDHGDVDQALREALAGHDEFIAGWMRDPPQTNEVGRAAAIMAALLAVRRRFPLPVELLELGSSAGLNLNMAHYAYDLGGVTAGKLDSAVRIVPEWRGAAPPAGPVDVLAARGADLQPLDPRDLETCERLMAYVFVDQPARAARLSQALALARRHPPAIAREDAATWLAGELAEPAADGRVRVVFHSMVMQYVGSADRRRLAESIAAAGAMADRKRPLAWIGFEWNAARTRVELRLTCWPTGDARLLAICHPYGAWVHWLAEDNEGSSRTA
ncbi:DUF2332 domain-containing protein [Sphingomonas sp. BK580]|uniref:DUF2332 domain-containing protein n=1 Tax=Sphingomonas sp. BK580 TaxID=2586972 RepID=UPI001611DFEF|nr:DUF2332 family protein [Sphingomonas sp. BK580]MBB3695204.1 hypothetical protein [Sphingomonas sp. BK580]